MGAETEAFLAPMFIEGDEYGTRCSTVLAISPKEIRFTEQSFAAAGQPLGRVCQSWRPTVSG